MMDYRLDPLWLKLNLMNADGLKASVLADRGYECHGLNPGLSILDSDSFNAPCQALFLKVLKVMTASSTHTSFLSLRRVAFTAWNMSVKSLI